VSETLILPGALALMVVLVGLLFIGGEDKTKKRAAALGRKQSGSTDKGVFSFLKSDEGGSRRKQIEESLGKLEEDQKDKKKKRKSLASKLIQANSTMKAQTFMIISVILAAFAGGVPFIMQQDWKLCVARTQSVKTESQSVSGGGKNVSWYHRGSAAHPDATDYCCFARLYDRTLHDANGPPELDDWRWDDGVGYRDHEKND